MDEYKDEAMSDLEKEQAEVSVAVLNMKIRSTESDLTMINEQIEAKIPEKQARLSALELVKQKEKELETYKIQLTMYQNRLDTGMKKVPFTAEETSESPIDEVTNEESAE